jgi:group I intron endonuclease
MTCGIYVIRNKINGKEYYGQSLDVEKRKQRHHKNSLIITNAIEKYGNENFDRLVILYCEEKELDYYEIECIRIFRSLVIDGGYNILPGGHSGRRGIKTPDVVKEKISKGGLGKKRTPITKERLSKSKSGENNPQYGKRGKDSASYGRKNSLGVKRFNASSIYYGVYKRKDRERCWITRITINRKIIRIGSYMTELESAKAWDKYIIENKLSDYPLNFPEHK